MRRARRAALLCALAGLSQQSIGGAPVSVFVNARQSPNSELGKDGVLRGDVIDTAATVLRDAGIDHELIALPHPRAFERVKACEGLMAGVFKSPERARFLMFSEPIVADRVALVLRADDPLAYAAPNDLAGRSVTYLRGAVVGIDLRRVAAGCVGPAGPADFV